MNDNDYNEAMEAIQIRDRVVEIHQKAKDYNLWLITRYLLGYEEYKYIEGEIRDYIK